jgi:hypothetical protein
MLSNLSFWWARRCALVALCTSLEQQPEEWKVSEHEANRDGIRIQLLYDTSVFFDRKAFVQAGGKGFLPRRRWSQRIRRAMKRSAELATLKAAVIALKPSNTPLQIEEAKHGTRLLGEL